MGTLKEFIRRNHITIRSEWADHNPAMERDGGAPMNHYKVRLRRGGKQYTLLYSMGLGLSGEPQVEDVLDCLAADAVGVENAGGFEQWAREYGYNEDSRADETLYRLCERQARRLEGFLGQDLYLELLWDTESA